MTDDTTRRRTLTLCAMLTIASLLAAGTLAAAAPGSGASPAAGGEETVGGEAGPCVVVTTDPPTVTVYEECEDPQTGTVVWPATVG